MYLNRGLRQIGFTMPLPVAVIALVEGSHTQSGLACSFIWHLLFRIDCISPSGISYFLFAKPCYQVNVQQSAAVGFYSFCWLNYLVALFDFFYLITFNWISRLPTSWFSRSVAKGESWGVHLLNKFLKTLYLQCNYNMFCVGLGDDYFLICLFSGKCSRYRNVKQFGYVGLA